MRSHAELMLWEVKDRRRLEVESDDPSSHCFHYRCSGNRVVRIRNAQFQNYFVVPEVGECLNHVNEDFCSPSNPIPVGSDCKLLGICLQIRTSYYTSICREMPRSLRSDPTGIGLLGEQKSSFTWFRHSPTSGTTK
jgi:hypothetical protein